MTFATRSGHEQDDVGRDRLVRHDHRIALHRDVWTEILTKVSDSTTHEFLEPTQAVARLQQARRAASTAGLARIAMSPLAEPLRGEL